jgi:hypothetical protein
MPLHFFFEGGSFWPLFLESGRYNDDRSSFRGDALGYNARHVARRYRDEDKVDGLRQYANRCMGAEAADFRPSGIYGIDPAFEAAEQISKNRMTHASRTVGRPNQGNRSRRKEAMQSLWIEMVQFRTHEFRPYRLASRTVTSKITKSSEWKCDPHGVEHRREVDEFLRHGAADRWKPPECRENHASRTQQHSPNRAFKRNLPHASADVNQFIHFRKRTIENDGVSGLTRDVVLVPECDSYRGRLHRRCVIDSVSDVRGFCRRRLGEYEFNFFFGRSCAVGSLYSNLIGE